jgi:hypothetical protein
VELIEVASFAFAEQFGTGTLFELKCLFAIDSITAVYSDYWVQTRRIALGYGVNSELIFPN